MKDILVLAEHRNGQLLPVTAEMLSLARELADHDGGGITMVIMDQAPLEMARSSAETFGVDVLAVGGDHFETYNPEVFLEVLAGIGEDRPARYILAAHTTTGMDLTPALAVRLKAALVTGVEGVRWKEGRPRFARAMFGGKIEAHFTSQARTTILTVMPGIFKTTDPVDPPGSVRFLESRVRPKRVRVRGVSEGRGDEAALGEAEVIVAVGRGLGRPENIDLARQLVGRFPRAALAGSRPVCDQGWLEYRYQVGQTGATVNPKLYIALGISGARQHTMGMQGSGFIVAVSTDPQAAIFNIADVCIVENMADFIPIWLDRAGPSIDHNLETGDRNLETGEKAGRGTVGSSGG